MGDQDLDPSELARSGEHLDLAVLLIEDSPDLLHHAACFLRALGLTVVGAFEDATLALAHVKGLAPDVALVDLRLQGLSGLQAIALLRDTAPMTGIVALSLSPGYRRVALGAGADEFIDKASFDTELLPAIRRAAGAPTNGSRILPLHRTERRPTNAGDDGQPRREEVPGAQR